jgi:hypothetical protein
LSTHVVAKHEISNTFAEITSLLCPKTVGSRRYFHGGLRAAVFSIHTGGLPVQSFYRRPDMLNASGTFSAGLTAGVAEEAAVRPGRERAGTGAGPAPVGGQVTKNNGQRAVFIFFWRKE